MSEPRPRPEKGQRKAQILQALAGMLEQGTSQKITTAELAKQVDLSEAALYRHFPSKTRMFEALVEFAEETLFSRIRAISQEPLTVQQKCYRITALLLGFAEKNPGISRLLTGEPLTGEAPRLLQRIQQLFERYETQLKQLLREAEYQEGVTTMVSSAVAANLITSLLEGKLQQFIRSSFNRLPTEGWQDQWQVIEASLFHSPQP